MTSDVVWMVDGIQVVWSPKYAVYEVWQRVEQDGETVLWDCVADTPDQEEAIEEAKEIHFAKLRETGESGSTEMPPLDVDAATSLFPEQVREDTAGRYLDEPEVFDGYGDYYESGIDF